MKLRKLELLDDGTHNEVYATTDPDKIFRISKEPLEGEDYEYMIEEVDLIHKINRELGTGNAIPHLYKSIVVEDEKSCLIIERFDMSLQKYMQNACFDTMDDIYDTACQAIDIFLEILNTGVNCIDIKPNNFVINLERVPYGYTGDRTKNFVRMVDLDSYFCLPTEEFIPPEYSSKQKKELMDLFKSLLILQFLSMYLNDDDAKNAKITGNTTMIIEIATKYNVCLSRKGINLFLELLDNCEYNLLPRSYEQLCKYNWKKLYSLFEHYEAKSWYEQLPFCEHLHKNISILPNKLPQIFHQIWLGDDKPPAHIQTVINGWKAVSKWKHYLWRRKDLKYLPVTKWIGENILFPKGKSKNNQKLQQIFLGVMKLEILYRIGGVYIDIGMKCNIDSNDKLELFNELLDNKKSLTVAHQYTKEKGPIKSDFLASFPKISMLKTILTKKIFSEYDTFDQLFGHSIPKSNVEYIPYTGFFYPNDSKPLCSSTKPHKGFKPVNFGTLSARPKTLYIDSKCCKNNSFPESLMYKLF